MNFLLGLVSTWISLLWTDLQVTPSKYIDDVTNQSVSRELHWWRRIFRCLWRRPVRRPVSRQRVYRGTEHDWRLHVRVSRELHRDGQLGGKTHLRSWVPLGLKATLHFTSAFASPSKFIILSIAKQTLMQWMGSEPISTFAHFVTIDAVLIVTVMAYEQCIIESLFLFVSMWTFTLTFKGSYTLGLIHTKRKRKRSKNKRETLKKIFAFVSTCVWSVELVKMQTQMQRVSADPFFAFTCALSQALC